VVTSHNHLRRAEELATVLEFHHLFVVHQQNYTLGKLDQYGQRITIPITLEGQGAAAGRVTTINTGWIIEPNGSIRLLTPFAGFAP